jgi:hypothetical protein
MFIIKLFQQGGGEMKKNIITFVLFVLLFSISLAAQWVVTYGGNEWYSLASSSSIQQTNDGGYIVAGGRIVKFSSSANVEWQYQYRCTLSYIQQTNDGGYIAAGNRSGELSGYTDLSVLKLTNVGGVEWSKAYGSKTKTEWAASIQQTSEGGYIVAGSGYFAGFHMDFWILKLSSVGDVEWQRTYGGYKGDYLHGAHQTTDGGYIIAGTTESFGAGEMDCWILKLNPNGHIEWQRTYGGSGREAVSSIQQTFDGGCIVAGTTNSLGAGGTDYWILKLNPKGEIEWQRIYENSIHGIASSIQQTNDAGYIVVGPLGWHGFFMDYNICIIKLNPLGDIVWQKEFIYTGSDFAKSVIQTLDGGYIVAGSTPSGNLGKDNLILLKLNSEGEVGTCPVMKNLDVRIVDTNFSPQDTNIDPQPTYVTPQKIRQPVLETYGKVNLAFRSENIFILRIKALQGGATSPTPGSYLFWKGEEIKLTAIPESEYNFYMWRGDVPSGHEKVNPLIIIMDSDKLITADFISHIYPLYPPLESRGKKVSNRSLSQVEYINVLTWQHNLNNRDIVEHRIYLVEGEAKNLLAEISFGTYDYWHRKVQKDKKYTYAITAVDNKSRESAPAYITVK